MNEERWEGRGGETRDEEREVRTLIEAAGRRPSLPQGDLAAIRGAVEETWSGRYERGSARTARLVPWLLAAALAATAIGLGWWFWARPPVLDGDRVASVERLAGAAAVRENNGPAQPLQRLRTLGAGSVVSTAAGSEGETSFATLRLASGHSLRLDADSRLRLWTTQLLELERGAIYVDSDGSEVGRAVEVVTRFGTVTEIGTRFEVRLIENAQPALRVRVRGGRVRLRSDERRATAEAGEELLLDVDGSIERRLLVTYGDEWSWVLDSAPGLELGDKTVAEVLEWVSRETGWEIRFASEELEKARATVPFTANVKVLRPQEAPDFLPGVGLDAELVDGVLWVRATDE